MNAPHSTITMDTTMMYFFFIMTLCRVRGVAREPVEKDYVNQERSFRKKSQEPVLYPTSYEGVKTSRKITQNRCHLMLRKAF
jgi:hypothetical protein